MQLQVNNITQNLEHEFLSYYGLNQHYDYCLYDVQVPYRDITISIRTFHIGQKSKKPLVMFHGYGSSYIQYCKIFNDLAKEYRIYAIDLPGMGFSSKEGIKLSTYENSLDFFMSTLEQWINAHFLKGFVLVAHSFGGYIASQLAVRHPEKIEKLLLISPLGVTDYNQQEQIKLEKKSSLLTELTLEYLEKQFEIEATPAEITRRWYGDYIVQIYLTKKLKLKGKELQVWENYIKKMYDLPIGSEKALFYMFRQPRCTAKVSIEQLFEENYERLKDKQICFYYGDEDWMDDKGAINMCRKYKNMSRKIIPKSNHQPHFENDRDFVKQLMQDLKN